MAIDAPVYDRFAGQLCEKRCRSPIEVNNAPGMQRYDKHYLRHRSRGAAWDEFFVVVVNANVHCWPRRPSP
jgi:hypothetical protein